MSWIITGTEKLPSDPDAASYIANVEAADGQELEYDVRMAINTFVKGCKADGIWDAIKASCILAGARTLSGALVPLAGTAPTNFNFVSGDYNRKTGLIGDGSTKYLDSNRNNNADPQDNSHHSFWLSGISSASRMINSGLDGIQPGTLTIAFNGTQYNLRNRANTAVLNNGAFLANSLVAMSRNVSTSFVFRSARANTTVSQSSQTPTLSNITLYFGDGAFSDARLAFYSIGEALDLALLDARVTTLMSDLATAIP